VFINASSEQYMTNLAKRNSHVGPASREEIIKIAGEIDDMTISAILKTGATYAEVEKAFLLLIGQDEFADTGVVTLSGAQAAVYDILAESPAFADPERL